MDSGDLSVLMDVRDWHRAGHAVTLVTVIETWGSAPRPPGALLAVRDDGIIAGSVSGGCVEDDLIERVRRGERPAVPTLTTYGVTREEAARFGLPCGGTLRLVVEPVNACGWIDDILARTADHRLVARTLDLEDGTIALDDARRTDAMQFDGRRLTTIYGPRWRLLVIGAGQLSRILAHMAQPLGYEVLVCDPREEYAATLAIPGVRHLPGMPDDVVEEIRPDAHTAIVAVTHDPKLDDMALLTALRSPAFYIGALGSRANTAKRKERLAMFDLAPHEIDRLHGPIGLDIGSRAPAEIAVSILAEITAVKNHVALRQKKPEGGEGVTPVGPVCGVNRPD